jgi:hypothetical protein
MPAAYLPLVSLLPAPPLPLLTEARLPASDFVVVRWNLTAATSKLLTERDFDDTAAVASWRKGRPTRSDEPADARAFWGVRGLDDIRGQS